MSTTSYTATAQHISLLGRKRGHLTALMDEATDQCVTFIAREWQAGNFTWNGLEDAYNTLRSSDPPNLTLYWAQAGLPAPNKIRMQIENLPDPDLGYWHGRGMTLDKESKRPLDGDYVVYVLLDESKHPIYVGSTDRFNKRMAEHRKAKQKEWAYWIAYPCNDREEAYQLEERFQSGYLPALNKRSGR